MFEKYTGAEYTCGTGRSYDFSLYISSRNKIFAIREMYLNNEHYDGQVFVEEEGLIVRRLMFKGACPLLMMENDGPWQRLPLRRGAG